MLPRRGVEGASLRRDNHVAAASGLLHVTKELEQMVPAHTETAAREEDLSERTSTCVRGMSTSAHRRRTCWKQTISAKVQRSLLVEAHLWKAGWVPG